MHSITSIDKNTSFKNIEIFNFEIVGFIIYTAIAIHSVGFIKIENVEG
jgi:hypothetical protein